MAMAEIVLRIARIYIALSTSHAGAGRTGRTSIARVAQKTGALWHEPAKLLLRRRKHRSSRRRDRRDGRERDRPRDGNAARALAVSMVLGALGEWLNLPKL
jgi:hypothetical protein